ncbi:APO protein 3, mitochondrial [Apostasia shenzhenica]|uniref:APO protein 3, mitochondrial n=1 Tax=Apostasia shenzhenica TaxID=1088818 RepID=A0A2I0A0L6_9ASPA|nr:APO protein 3, mitochondrial [Apostasia shenzhenica]
MHMGRTLFSHISDNVKRALQCERISSAPISSQIGTLLSKVGGEDKEEEGEGPYMDVLRPRKQWERKPYVTPMKLLIRRAKEEKQARQENPCQILEHAPGNGLLVPELIEVAHQVNKDANFLIRGLSRLIEGGPDIPVHRCRFCPELHVSLHGHEIRTCEGPGSGSRNSHHVWRRGGVKDIVGFAYSYHLFDRVCKPRVGHKERLDVPRLPAITELCIQAGLDLHGYPTKRRATPVYSIEGRIVDFQPHKEEETSTANLSSAPRYSTGSCSEEVESMNVDDLATKILRSWHDMRTGAVKIMNKYNAVTCGYCNEVQVGPKGHKVRMCKAAKHQFRDGQHAWQEATINDVIWPNYVWHVRDPGGLPLANVLKRYYGKAPAVVEVCVQAGASVPMEYRSTMRLDAALPDPDEYDLVV